jgi:hypothetical protein
MPGRHIRNSHEEGRTHGIDRTKRKFGMDQMQDIRDVEKQIVIEREQMRFPDLPALLTTILKPFC